MPATALLLFFLPLIYKGSLFSSLFATRVQQATNLLISLGYHRTSDVGDSTSEFIFSHFTDELSTAQTPQAPSTVVNSGRVVGPDPLTMRTGRTEAKAARTYPDLSTTYSRHFDSNPTSSNMFPPSFKKGTGRARTKGAQHVHKTGPSVQATLHLLSTARMPPITITPTSHSYPRCSSLIVIDPCKTTLNGLALKSDNLVEVILVGNTSICSLRHQLRLRHSPSPFGKEE